MFKSNGNRDYSKELFIVKYAPTRLIEFAGNIGLRQTFFSYIDQNNIPNMIVTGPHGTGKTTAVKLLVKQYFNEAGFKYSDYHKQGFLEIYGSLSRGKDVFCESQTVKNKQKNFNNASIVDFMKRATRLPKHLVKIVVIYEFHQMSVEAQMALRRIMEINSKKIRFIFVPGNLDMVIPAIQSRCTILKTFNLTEGEMRSVLDPIVEAEPEFKLTPELFKLIQLKSQGDIRIAVNMLQLLGRTTEIDKYSHILGIPEITTIEGIIEACRAGKGGEAYKLTRNLMESGYDISDMIDILTRVLISYPEFSEKNDFLRALAKGTFTVQECYTITQFYQMINQMIIVKN